MAFIKIKAKGTVFAQYVTSAYVSMEGLTSVSIDGEKSETVDSTTLDGGVYKTKNPTGYSDTATIKLAGHYDPVHATFTNFVGLIAAPAATNFKVTWTDVAPTSAIYSGVGFGINKKSEVGKLVMADLEIETSGAPS